MSRLCCVSSAAPHNDPYATPFAANGHRVAIRRKADSTLDVIVAFGRIHGHREHGRQGEGVYLGSSYIGRLLRKRGFSECSSTFTCTLKKTSLSSI